MKVNVNKDACIGCGACAAICDTVFTLDDEGLSELKKDEINEDEEQAVRDSADSCPTAAIEVTE